LGLGRGLRYPSARRCAGESVGGVAEKMRHGLMIAERAQLFICDDVADADGDAAADLVAHLVEEQGIAQRLVDVGRGLEPAAGLTVEIHRENGGTRGKRELRGERTPGPVDRLTKGLRRGC